MTVASPDKEWLSVKEAADEAGCTVGWIRLLLGRGELRGWKASERAWMVRAADVEDLRKNLTSRSVGKRDTKPTPKKRRKSR